MKCVVGVDLERRSASVIELLGRLQLAIDDTVLLHVTEPMQLALPYSAYGMFVETDEIYETLKASGESVLAEANVRATELGLHPRNELCEGYPTSTLADFASHSGAKLIAVTSTVRGTIGAVFGGSVARGLAISAHQSILVAREEPIPDRPLHAVFATDQSPYCAECAKLLIQMAPKGISHLTLLTVHERSKHEGHLKRIRHTGTHQALDEAHVNLTIRGEEISHWLTQHGIDTESCVVSGHVDETIHKVMKETQADLLIIGSQGHGFVDRVLVGSASLHQVICERYPVLLLRPPKTH